MEMYFALHLKGKPEKYPVWIVSIIIPRNAILGVNTEEKLKSKLLKEKLNVVFLEDQLVIIGQICIIIIPKQKPYHYFLYVVDVFMLLNIIHRRMLPKIEFKS